MSFYHELILKDDASTVRLYLNKDKINKYQEIARAPLKSSMSFNVDINWVQGTDFVTKFYEGYANAKHAMREASRSFDQGIQKIKDPLNDLVEAWTGRKDFFGRTAASAYYGQSQSRPIFGSDYYAKFGGSESSLGIPDQEFIFIDEGNTGGNRDKYINDAITLLDHTLPILSAERNLLDTAIKNDPSVRQKVNKSKAKKLYYMMESPPNDFKNAGTGLSPTGLTNDMTLCLGYTELPHVLPSRVDMDYSMTGSIYGGVWRPHFIRIRVGFRPAMKITANDIREYVKSKQIG